MTPIMKSIFCFSLIIIFVSGCISDKQFTERVKKTLLENPNIISEAVSKDPKKFIMVLQKASQKEQMETAKKRREEEKRKLEEYYKNPLKPVVGKHDPIRGNKNAPITLIMYSDFQCPYCVQGVETVNKLIKKYGSKIRYIYKHLPLVSLGHIKAPLAAKYFEAIAVQSVQKAFKFHDELYKNQRRIRQGEGYFKTVAKKLKVKMKTLAIDLKSKRVQDKMVADQEEAKKFNFRGTPGFLLNGIPIYGAYPYDYFEQVIDRLKKTGKLKL